MMWVAVSGQKLMGQPVTHPLDPLTVGEYATAVTLLKAADHVNDDSRYPMITLQEPVKSEILQWKPGDPVPRAAFMIVKHGPQIFEAVVNLTGMQVQSWREVKGIQPSFLMQEWRSAQEIVLAHPDWQAAVRKRGLTSFEGVVCTPLTVGYYGLAEEEGHRLFKVPCFDSRGIKNYWGRPIEGVTAVVDIDKRQVIKLIDTGVIPIPNAPVDIDEHSVGTLREAPTPLSSTPPNGLGFTVAGHEVNWQRWQFHFRIDPRLGLVISLVRYEDKGSLRSILYQGSLSELFVPYMDPDSGWYFRTYMDAGEYGVGKFAVPLKPQVDCPPTAVYVNAVFANDQGVPYIQRRAACLFERAAGDIAWRHYEVVNGQNESRQERQLVVRFITAVGNYDYIFDWVFRQNGTITVALGTSGIAQVKAVKSRNVADDPDGRDMAYGHLVASHTLAVHHDHFLNFRLDLDIEGPQNSMLIEALIPRELSPESPRRSTWIIQPQTPTREQEAKLHIMMDKPALWRVINPNVKGPLGYPVSYEIIPTHAALSLLSPKDYPQRRAGFTDYHLWVTPYNPEERYAGGMYPNQSKGGDGLPSWTKSNRSIENTDIVLWYTIGLHHIVRAEDWPVLPTVWHEFELRPFDFFERNPALDLPK
jgi:primary-amine oxidase